MKACRDVSPGVLSGIMDSSVGVLQVFVTLLGLSRDISPFLTNKCDYRYDVGNKFSFHCWHRPTRRDACEWILSPPAVSRRPRILSAGKVPPTSQSISPGEASEDYSTPSQFVETVS